DILGSADGRPPVMVDWTEPDFTGFIGLPGRWLPEGGQSSDRDRAPPGACRCTGFPGMTALERLQETGIRRVRSGKGFAFRTARGSRVAASELPRIRKLAIPPAWTDVFVAPSATAKLQAVGKDRAGRWQYRYHPRFRERQDQRKFQKLV